jgi:hypothetical protein
MNAQQIARLSQVEESVKRQKAALKTAETTLTRKMATVELAMAQQEAKMATVEAIQSQHNSRIGATEKTVRPVEVSSTQLAARLCSVETAIRKQAESSDLWMSACSQICVELDGRLHMGSGWFYCDTLDDLRHGYFVTAAHCVVKVADERVLTMTRGFIQDPTTSSWARVDVTRVFYDGVADVALIKTAIDLTGHPHCCLQLAVGEQSAGDTCWVVANPGGLYAGCILDPHYCDPSGCQTTDSILVTCSGMGGGPIVNQAGMVVGVYTFRAGESSGGGSNKETLRQCLSVLKALRNNGQKRFLGLDWDVPSPFVLSGYYPADARFSSCVRVRRVDAHSPFALSLSEGDLLLNAILPDGNVVEFGNANVQKTPGVLMYHYEPVTVRITYVKPDRSRVVATVLLDKSYDDLPPTFDGPLQTGVPGFDVAGYVRPTALAKRAQGRHVT